MTAVTPQEVYDFLMDDHERLDRSVLEALLRADLRRIVCDFEVSVGDVEMVRVVDEVVGAIEGGYKVLTWLGPECEVLVVGYRVGELALV